LQLVVVVAVVKKIVEVVSKVLQINKVLHLVEAAMARLVMEDILLAVVQVVQVLVGIVMAIVPKPLLVYVDLDGLVV
jgi:hypothetical protein